MRKKFFEVVLVTIFLFAIKVEACDCYKILNIEESKHIFKGKVVGIKKIEVPFIRYEITVMITKKIKGDLNCKRITVNTPCLQDGCCGIRFKKGDLYEIYTYVDDDMIYTDACTLTKKLGSATKRY